jgi:hypothetical protein
MANKKHCILTSRILMKTMRNGCLNGERGNDLSSGPSIMGEPKRPPGVEYTGEYLDNGAVFNE